MSQNWKQEVFEILVESMLIHGFDHLTINSNKDNEEDETLEEYMESLKAEDISYQKELNTLISAIDRDFKFLSKIPQKVEKNLKEAFSLELELTDSKIFDSKKYASDIIDTSLINQILDFTNFLKSRMKYDDTDMEQELKQFFDEL